MKIVVDFDVCEGHGLCVAACPEVFQLDDYGALVLLQKEPPPELDAEVRSAAALCPTAAITAG